MTKAEAKRLLVGLSVEGAKGELAKQDHTLRVVREDGRNLPHADDARVNRVNVEVESGVVIAVKSIG